MQLEKLVAHTASHVEWKPLETSQHRTAHKMLGGKTLTKWHKELQSK